MTVAEYDKNLSKAERATRRARKIEEHAWLVYKCNPTNENAESAWIATSKRDRAEILAFRALNAYTETMVSIMKDA
jgi:hypothetical protein